MNAFQRRVAWRVLAIHLGVIGFLALVTMMKGCFRPKPKPEILTYIEFGQPAPPVAMQEVQDLPDPEPPAPQPEPEPPPPEPVKIPEQPKKIIKPPKKVEPPKKIEPKKTEPKWKPVDPKDIKIGKKVEPAKPPKPAVDPREISKALSSVQQPSAATPNGPVGNPSEIAAYDALINSVFQNAWAKPAAPAARPASVTISISSSGRVTGYRLTQPSGDAQWDATVMAAVKSVRMLPRPPPKGYPLDNIIVRFQIIN